MNNGRNRAYLDGLLRETGITATDFTDIADVDAFNDGIVVNTSFTAIKKERNIFIVSDSNKLWNDLENVVLHVVQKLVPRRIDSPK